WVCDFTGFGDYCQWQLVGGYDATSIPAVPPNPPSTVGKDIITAAQSGFGLGLVPSPRLGAAAWTDASGNFWLFGGSNGNTFRNDLWMYNASALGPGSYTSTEGTWTPVLAGGIDQAGSYTSGTLIPGSRTNPVSWTDGSGNFWLFGGYGYDSA